MARKWTYMMLMVSCSLLLVHQFTPHSHIPLPDYTEILKHNGKGNPLKELISLNLGPGHLQSYQLEKQVGKCQPVSQQLTDILAETAAHFLAFHKFDFQVTFAPRDLILPICRATLTTEKRGPPLS